VTEISGPNEINRRDFIRATALGVGYCLWGNPFAGECVFGPAMASAQEESRLKFHPAQYYKKLEDLEIECQLCPRKCVVGERERGYCGVRENKGGEYFTLVYGNPCSANIDPIEKKPFFHFLPGAQAFSIATAGCNLNCKFCQNWQISQFRPEQIRSLDYSADEVAAMAANYGCRAIAYTYSEPTVFYEYMLDCARAGSERNIKSVMVSAGFISAEPMKNLLPHLAAVKIDLKSFSQKYYEDICSGELQPVLDTLTLLSKSGIWYEIVYLMLPTLNDDPKELGRLCRWIKSELGPDVPIHFTRFHPEYLLKSLPSTPVASLERGYDIAKAEGLHFPYIGNVPGHKGENTFCPGCGAELIVRRGFQVSPKSMKDGRCEKCGYRLPGVWA
jgi:pyruvate formate lyase activating enzyme